MSLIDSFSKPRWQHNNPEVRKTAIAVLDDQEVLAELVKSDPEPELQSLALARIDNPEMLDELIEALKEDLQNQAREQRLHQLLPDSSKMNEIKDDDALIRIAGLTNDSALVSQALTHVKSAEVIMQIASTHPQARMRLSAAKNIDDLESLQQLMQRSMNKDKAVYRHCKKLLDEHQAKEQAEADVLQQVQSLSDKASELAGTADAIDFKGRYLFLKQQWPGLQQHANSDQSEIIEAALKLGTQRQQEENQSQVARLEETALIESSQESFTSLLTELEELDQTGLDHSDQDAVARINTKLNEIEEGWVAALRHAKATAEQTSRCKVLLNDWRRMLLTEQRLQSKGSKIKKVEGEARKADQADYLTLQRKLKDIDRLIKEFVWPESHISIMPEPIKRLHKQRNAITEKLDSLKNNEKKNLERLDAAFEKFRKELETNHFDNADREYRRLKNVLRQLSPDQQQRYQQELRPLMAKLNEIHDWQGFAIEPKKLDLITRMKSLIDTAEDTDVLALKIKSMQAEWKQLGHLAPHRDQELWLEFKAAADKAYEPCKAAFAKRAEFYEQNTHKRMEVIAQLIDYDRKMHWPDSENTEGDYHAPDWKLVQKTLDTARQAVRDIKPVDRRGERLTQKKLKKICDRIYSHIKHEYERNITQKEQLLERARSLVELEDLDEAINQAKRIQREWKDVGITPMQVDRNLWKKFRSACDAVFARLDEKRKQVKEAMGAQIGEAEELLSQARALIDSKDEEQQLHLKKELGNLHTALRQIQLPPRVRQQMNKHFSDMEQEARNRVSAIRKMKERLGWQQMATNLKACALLKDDESQARKLWQDDIEIPKGVDANALASFWDQGTGNTDSEVLREACIALEILFEKESPAQDKQARMAYQMKRLVEGIGGQVNMDQNQQLFEQLNRFIEMKPSTEWVERYCETIESEKG